MELRLLAILFGFHACVCYGKLLDLRVLSQDASIVIGETQVAVFFVYAPENLNQSLPLFFTSDNPAIITDINNVTLPNVTGRVNIPITGQKAGHTTLSAIVEDPNIDTTEAFVRVTVIRSYVIWILCLIVGWIYFAAWSLSFYPQIFENYKRKSVVGLSLDLVVLNFWGHSVYALFNFGLYWIPEVKKEYFNIHPLGVQPVQLNDCMFSLHAIVAAAVTFFQCFIYERNGQTLSVFAWTFLAVTMAFLCSSLACVLFGWMTWLTFLYFCSYVKLAVTSTKYIPQAYLNYRRKSTDGWSVGNVLLDLTGGLLSVFQMFLVSYNNDDWDAIFGDPTKFGLGVVSVFFDIFFVMQHYVWYRKEEQLYETIEGESSEEQLPVEDPEI